MNQRVGKDLSTVRNVVSLSSGMKMQYSQMSLGTTISKMDAHTQRTYILLSQWNRENAEGSPNKRHGPHSRPLSYTSSLAMDWLSNFATRMGRYSLRFSVMLYA